MGTTHLHQFPGSATAPSLPPPLPILLTNHHNPLYQNPTSTSSISRISDSTRRRSTVCGARGGRPRWDSNAEKTVGAERFRFNLDDEVVIGDEDGHDGFGFGSGAKKRAWWSDDSMDIEDDDEGFGVLEDSIDASWIFKVLNAFGWMLPAIVISMLLGTGPNAFVMALVLPIAQSAVSLATDTFWGRSRGSPKPKRRTKKKPSARAANGENKDTESGNARENYARAASDIGMNRENKDAESGNARENYQSWVAANDYSTKTRDKRAPGFGGWDELDKRMGSYKIPKGAQKANKPKQQKTGKLGRRVRNRDTPLLLRLLIAVFPFLGSWTKLL